MEVTIRLRVIASALGVLAFTACGGGSATQKAQGSPSSGVVQQNGGNPAPSGASQAARRNVEVVKSGFTQHPPDSIGNSYVDYAAVILNPNPKDWFAQVQVTTTLKDDAGTVVSSQNDSVNILPNQTVAISGSPQAKGATKIEVQAFVNNWTKLQSAPGAFTVEGLNYVPPPQYSSFSKVTGTISSTFARDLQSVQVTVVFEDANGGILGGGGTYVNFVPAGGKTSFEISSQVTTKPAKVEGWAEISNLSLIAPTP